MKKVAILFGANSCEHEISIVSAIAMKKVLKSKNIKKNIELVYIFIDFFNNFYLIPTNTINIEIFCKKLYKNYPQLTLNKNGFYSKSFFNLCSKQIKFDIALNLIHGKYGEDGTLASLLSFYNINAITPNLDACIVSYNKILTKTYAKNRGVKTLSFNSISDNCTLDNVLSKIKFPCIIKPVRGGSSIGISVANSSDELDYAIDCAKEFDSDILIEPFIKNIKEYNLAGVKINNQFIFGIIEEPTKDKFLDFDKKYLDFARTNIIKKANISKKLKLDMHKTFCDVYNDMFEGAIIRCDFFVLDDKIYLNEINPVPGSMANYLFDDFLNVFNNLCSDVIEKNKIKNKKIQECKYEYINKIQGNK